MSQEQGRFRFEPENRSSGDLGGLGGILERGEILPTAAQVSRNRQTKAQRVLERLRRGPATTYDLNRITPAYSQRIGEMKRELGIEVKRVDHVGPDGEWSLYLLTKDVE